SDILALKVGDVSDEYITLHERKTGKRKRIRVNSAIQDAVNRLVPTGASADEWLFPSRKGTAPISRVQAWRVLNAAADRAGLNIELGTHSLLKSCAAHAHTHGTDIALLMRVLNHGRQRETLRYIAIEQEALDGVYLEQNL